MVSYGDILDYICVGFALEIGEADVKVKLVVGMSRIGEYYAVCIDEN